MMKVSFEHEANSIKLQGSHGINEPNPAVEATGGSSVSLSLSSASENGPHKPGV